MIAAVRYDKREYSIASEYDSIGEDETRSGQVCPSCEGGQTKEKSLSVWRRGGVLGYKCHRASCGFGGRVGSSGSGSSRGRPASRATTLRTYPIGEEALGLLASKFGISRQDADLAGLRWTGAGNGDYSRRVCYPIFGPDSRKRGENYRGYKELGTTGPKSIIRLYDEDGISQSWYRWRRRCTTLVIVEDQVSAMKLAPFYDTLALLGTNLSEAKVQEILDIGEGHYHDIFLCLDNDATSRSINLVLQWRDWLKGLKVRGLEKDIKDMDEVELDSFMLRLV